MAPHAKMTVSVKIALRLSLTLPLYLFAALAVPAFALAADVPVTQTSPDAIVSNYTAATQRQEQAQAEKTESMTMDISASLPKLKKQGKLHALRTIFARKNVTYGDISFEGDSSIKTDVIGRYLSAEAQAMSETQPDDVAVTPANYKFTYKGGTTLEGRPVFLFDVNPRKKRDKLFKGQVWIDAETYLLVQETGTLVKKPSFWMRNVAFTRRYNIRDGIAVPVNVETSADVAIIGKVEMTIAFSNFTLADAAESDNR